MNQSHPDPPVTCLVTGGSGLVGQVLIRQLLEQGYAVHATEHRRPIGVRHPRLQTCPIRLRDPQELDEVMAGVQEVYHCAGLISYTPRDRNALYQVNVDVTAQVVNACLRASVRKLVHVSSIAALGKFTPDRAIDETLSWTDDARASLYGHSKFLGELEVFRGVAEGLDAVIVNPGIILGPGDWRDGSTALFKKAHEGFSWYTDGVNGFVDVEDVTAAMIRLMRSDISAERFILVAENRSYQDVLGLMAGAFGTAKPYRKLTPALSRWLCLAESLRSRLTGRRPLITRETVHTALARVYFDNTKLLRFLPGFQYRTLEETINETCSILQQKFNN